MMGRQVVSGAFLVLWYRNIVQKVQKSYMTEGSSLHPKLQISSNALIDSSSQLPQELVWNFLFQMGQSSLVTPRSPMQSSPSVFEWNQHWQDTQGSSGESSIQMQAVSITGPGLPTLRRPSAHPSHQRPSSPSARSGFHVPTGPVALSDKYVEKPTDPVAPRTHRKERTQYSTEQKSMLQKQFAECQYPDRKKCVELASLVVVTEKEIKFWFKNNRAKCKQKNVPEALPETNGSSKAVSESTNFPGSIALVGPDNGQPMITATLDVESTPKFKCSQESSVHGSWTYGGAMSCLQEDMLDDNVPVTARDSGESAVVEGLADLAAAGGPVAIEAACQCPEDCQNLHPSEGKL